MYLFLLQHTLTLLLINLSNSTAFEVSVDNDMNLYPLNSEVFNSETPQGQREDYHLTAKDGNLTSRSMLLNGKLLNISSLGEIPKISPSINSASTPIHIAPSSIVFAKFLNSIAPACSDKED